MADFSSGSVGADAIDPDGSLTDVGGFSGGQITVNGEPNSLIAYPPAVCPAP